MKQRVPVRIQLAALAFGACVVGVASAVALAGRAATARANAAAQREVADLRHLDAQLNEELLRARFGVRNNYDEVSRVQRELEQRTGAGASVLPLQGDNDVDRERRALADEVLTKSNKIEEIKYRRAITRNSARYFSAKLVTDADSLAGADRERAATLERAILQLALTQDGDALESANAALAAIKTDGEDERLVQLRRHAATVVAGLGTNSDLRELVSVNTSGRIDALESAYRGLMEHQERRNTILLVTLAVLSSGLFIAIAWMLRRLSVMNSTARRFVPLEFLEMLGKESLADIRRGDAVRAEMSVLFADIRDFTARSEHRSPEENFRFMNEYLGAMEVPIHAHGGFVNQYLGDGIMALFPRSASSALLAACGMFEALERLNQSQGKDAVRIGIGINSGSLMLGTIGGRDRMNAGVISDSVNLAARVEGLTKQYGVRLLISDHTRSRLGSEGAVALRTIDRVLVKGTQRPVQLFQVIDAEPTARAQALLDVLPLHEQAMELYLNRRFAEAAPLFHQVHERVADDRASELLLARCEALRMNPPPPTWDGAERLDAK